MTIIPRTTIRARSHPAAARAGSDDDVAHRWM